MTTSRCLAFFLALVSLSPIGAQVRPLPPGRLTTTTIPAVTAPQLFNGPAGFTLDVPAEATSVEIRLTTAPPEADINLYARFEADVLRDENGDVVADFRSVDPGGAERIVIDESTPQPIQPGRYFIALEAGFGNPETLGFLLATIETTPGAGDLEIIAETTFENSQANGWTWNFPPPEPDVPGSTTGSPESSLVVRRGPRDFSRNLQLTARGNDYFVASPAFLGRLGLLGENARLEFDLAYIGESSTRQNVDLRLIGELTTYLWTAPEPPERDMKRFIVPLSGAGFQRIGGSDSFAEVLKNVLRIEIRGNYGEAGAVTFLDNVTLRGKAEPPTVPTLSDFESTLDGWEGNVAEAPFLASRAFGVTQGDFRTARTGVVLQNVNGNPGGFALVRDLEDAERDYLVAPDKFLGNYAALEGQAQFELDRRHVSAAGATRGVEIRLIGFGAAYSWLGLAPNEEWRRYTVPLREQDWALIDGDATFGQVLRAVQRIEVSMDEVAGSEESGLDNFRLTTITPVEPQLLSNPEQLSFNSVEGGSAPEPMIVQVSSNGPVIQWTATIPADAPWLSVTPESGETPAELAVMVDPEGLGAGVERSAVSIAGPGAVGAELPVTFVIASQSGPFISEGGVVNAANFASNAAPGGELTGGMFVAVFGERLAAETLRTAEIPLPTQLGDASLTIGGIPAPLVFVSPVQVVGVVPQALTQSEDAAQTLTEADVVAVRGGEASPPERVELMPVRPLLFSQNQTGAGPGAILNVSGGGQVQLNTFDAPARPGQAVSLFGTGFGPTQVPVPDGEAATGANPITGAVNASVGARTAVVSFAGLSPNSPHLYQANVIVPSDAPLGCEIPVSVAVDGVRSNEVTLAVSADGQPCN